MADFRSFFDQQFVGAWDLEGRDVTVTIAKVAGGEVMGDGRRERHASAYIAAAQDRGTAIITGVEYGALAWDMLHIALLDAAICLDCDVIFNIRTRQACPICATDKYFYLSRWLNRPCPCTSDTAAILSQLGNYCQTCNQERKAS